MKLVPLVLSSLGYFVLTFSYLVLLRMLIFAMDDVNEARRFLKEAAEDIKYIEDEERRLLIREVDNLKPVSAYGLFSVERSTLTSMVSTSITYLIIGIQFKQNGSPKK